MTWIPIEIRLHAGSGIVVWGDVDAAALREPFFNASIARLRVAGTLRVETTPLDALLAFEAVSAPSGFIFHVSRCGSTLAANALAAIAGSIVVSEASPITTALAAVQHGFSTDRQIALVRAVIGAIAAIRANPHAPLFVKFTSWSILRLAIVRAAWPQTRWMFLCRQPADVIVSLMRNRPAWLDGKDRPGPIALMGWTRAKRMRMSDEEFCARAIGRFCEFAAAALDAYAWVADYATLEPDALADFAASCNVVVTAEDRRAIAQTFKIYAKDETRSMPFERHASIDAALVAPHIRRAATAFALAPYEQIRASQAYAHR